MDVLVWHRELLSIKDTWLIHVNPEVIKIIGSNESLWMVQLGPVCSPLLIEEVYPCRLTGPAIPNKDVVSTVLYKIGFVSLRIDRVVSVCLDMGIGNDHHMAIMLLKLLVHIEDCRNGECLAIKHEVLLVL